MARDIQIQEMYLIADTLEQEPDDQARPVLRSVSSIDAA